MKIVDYIIACEANLLKLEISVQTAIKAGYEPLGGMCINPKSELDHLPRFLQPMVKYGTFAPLKDRPVEKKRRVEGDGPMGYNA